MALQATIDTRRRGQDQAMPSGTGILLVSQSAETAHGVTAALHDSCYGLRDVCRDLGEAVRHLEEGGSCAVLVDIDPEPAGMLAGLDLLTKRFAEARFIVLSSTLQSELMLEAMQV